jgi:hypothetical protein
LHVFCMSENHRRCTWLFLLIYMCFIKYWGWSHFFYFCSRPTVETSGANVNNICLESQNLGSVAHDNNSGLIYTIRIRGVLSDDVTFSIFLLRLWIPLLGLLEFISSANS